MRVAIVSHSAVHIRQHLFYRALAELGADVLVVGPKKWAGLLMPSSVDQMNRQTLVPFYALTTRNAI